MKQHEIFKLVGQIAIVGFVKTKNILTFHLSFLSSDIFIFLSVSIALVAAGLKHLQRRVRYNGPPYTQPVRNSPQKRAIYGKAPITELLRTSSQLFRNGITVL